MRWASLIFCCLLPAFTFAGVSAPLLAADVESSRKTYPDERLDSDDGQDVAAFCYEQRQMCRKICDLRSRFEDRFDGCPQSCVTRETRCVSSACFMWSEPEFLIAERFGGYKCAE